ncbi:MAG TPA: metal-dependent hydrolase [Vicinamibacterales bacterium]|nr:metal-dependent hydrolase [Vicinamibacterales bacterium]
MDPVSHAALARTLIAAVAVTPAPRVSRSTAAAAVLGSLSPDIDCVLMPFGWDIYLRAHEIGTHSIAGSFVCALLTAAVVRFSARRSSYRELAAAAWIGAFSHVVLDVVASARLRPAWPAVDAIVSLPLVAMADPWLLGLCVMGPLGIWLARRNQQQKTVTPSTANVPGSEQRAARLVLAAIAVFLTVKAGLGTVALSHYEREQESVGGAVLARVVEAQWASLLTWHVFDRTPAALRAWRASAKGTVERTLEWPIEPESSAVTASRGLTTVHNFLRAHDLGFAVASREPHNRIAVMWSDVRFCWSQTLTRPALPGDAVIPRAGSIPIACALWFGGELADDGTPLRQIVRVGSLTQTRDPGR